MQRRLQKLISNKPLHWTEHARFKMRQYGLSEARVKRVLRAPVRVEAGIAPKTVAVMTPAGAKRPQEIWVMYQDTKKVRKVIAAWRYPGISPVREPPPFPVEELRFLRQWRSDEEDE
jgi:hypothetical protein